MIFFLVLLACNDFTGRSSGDLIKHGPLWQALWVYGGWTVSGIAVTLTLYSGFDYLWRHRAMLEAD